MSILNFIKNIFKADSPQDTKAGFKSTPGAYYFHEDFYCQVEYLPKENFSTVSQMAAGITGHSEKTFDGYGWTGCYVRNEASVPTKSKNFTITELSSLLFDNGFTEYPGVTTGYSTVVIPCDNTKAFKKQSVVLCVDFKGDTIENIWHNNPPQQVDNEIYKSLMLAIAAKYNLLLVDWCKSIVIDISNPVEIEKYFVYDD